MAQSEKGLEEQLLKAGNGLLSPPSSVAELLALLDQVENFLTRVEQSPSESMKKALSPSMKALVADDLLKHPDIDVKVFVASCISEITRITAPDAPYEDDQMKEVFQLIVSSFEKLDDKSSLSYNKRASILETVAKVRSCVVMLDLECDALIVEMFQHFFRSIRDDHPENVFSSMETIMTLVLEESEDISMDLLSCILDFLKTENKEVLPIARQLGENVIEKCASKLKPYMLPAMKSQGASLDDYSKVVANVCQVGGDAVEPSDGDAASKNLADESDLTNAPPEKAVEVAMETLDDAPPSEEVGPTTAGSPKPVMSNGTLSKEIEDTSAGNNNSKEPDHDTQDQVETDAEPSKTIAESLDAVDAAKSQPKPEKPNKRKGRKSSTPKSSAEPSETSLTDDNKVAIKTPEHQEKDGKDVDSAHGEDIPADAAEAVENEKEPDPPVSSPKTLDSEPADVPSPSPSESLADETLSKKVARGKKKEESVEQSVATGDGDSKKESDTKKSSEATEISESKSQKRSVKKASSGPDKGDKIPNSIDASNKEDENTSEFDAKSAKQSGKKVEVVSSQREDKKKRGQVKGTPAKDPAKTPSKDVDKKLLPKSPAKSTKDESEAEKAPTTSAKRKRSAGKEKASDTKPRGRELVGSRVKVWWPDDEAYYEGVVESFDSAKKKHKILYDDGDIEVLNLAQEDWKVIDDSVADQEHASDGESPEESSETPKVKKAKTSADVRTKRGKTVSSAKKGGASSSKSKATTKSGGKQKDEGKSKDEVSKSAAKSDEDKAGKSKDKKAGNKSSDDTPKSIGKSKDDEVDTSKGGNKSKKDTPKSAAKSKGKSPKSNSKTNTNGTGKAKPVSSSKDEEADDEEMSPEPAKAPELATGKSPSTSKSQKSGKKRKR